MNSNELDLLIDYYYRQLSLGLEIDNVYDDIFKYKLDVEKKDLSLIEFLESDYSDLVIPNIFEKIDAEMIGTLDGILKSVDFNNVKYCKGVLVPSVEYVKSDYIEELPSTFAFCSLLKQFEFKNLKKVCQYLFYNCLNLEYLDLRSVEEIDNEAFVLCSNLKEIHLENIKRLGYNCFKNVHKDFVLIFHNMNEEEVSNLLDDNYPNLNYKIVGD